FPHRHGASEHDCRFRYSDCGNGSSLARKSPGTSLSGRKPRTVSDTLSSSLSGPSKNSTRRKDDLRDNWDRSMPFLWIATLTEAGERGYERKVNNRRPLSAWTIRHKVDSRAGVSRSTLA